MPMRRLEIPTPVATATMKLDEILRLRLGLVRGALVVLPERAAGVHDLGADFEGAGDRRLGFRGAQGVVLSAEDSQLARNVLKIVQQRGQLPNFGPAALIRSFVGERFEPVARLFEGLVGLLPILLVARAKSHPKVHAPFEEALFKALIQQFVVLVARQLFRWNLWISDR